MTAGWAPRARPARPPRGQMGPRSGATVQGSAFGLRVRRARIPYRLSAIRYVGVYARIGVALAAVAPDRYFACRNRDER